MILTSFKIVNFWRTKYRQRGGFCRGSVFKEPGSPVVVRIPVLKEVNLFPARHIQSMFF